VWLLRKKTETGAFQSSGKEIKFRYAPDTDTLWVWEADRTISHSEDTEFGIIDFNADDEIVGLETFVATKTLPVILGEEVPAESLPPTIDLAEELRKQIRNVPPYVSEVREHLKIG